MFAIYVYHLWTTIHVAGRGGSSGGAGGAQAPPTAAATMEPLLEPLLIFIGMKEMEEEL
jgi:hypothetical protein